jgi:hypothetical protein
MEYSEGCKICTFAVTAPNVGIKKNLREKPHRKVFLVDHVCRALQTESGTVVKMDCD